VYPCLVFAAFSCYLLVFFYLLFFYPHPSCLFLFAPSFVVETFYLEEDFCPVCLFYLVLASVLVSGYLPVFSGLLDLSLLWFSAPVSACLLLFSAVLPVYLLVPFYLLPDALLVFFSHFFRVFPVLAAFLPAFLTAFVLFLRLVCLVYLVFAYLLCAFHLLVSDLREFFLLFFVVPVYSSHPVFVYLPGFLFSVFAFHLLFSVRLFAAAFSALILDLEVDSYFLYLLYPLLASCLRF